MAARKGAAKATPSKRKVIDLPDASPETVAAALEEASLEGDTTVVGSADTQAVERVPRRLTAAQAELDPNTLCASWGLYSSPGEAETKQALVVAEVQPGYYLVEFYDVIDDEPREQRILTLDEFAKRDEEGGAWTFYDEHEEVRAAFKRLIK